MAARSAGLVARHAPVHAGVVLLLVLLHGEEEERALRQRDPVGRAEVEHVTVLEPEDLRRRSALGLAIERDRVIPRHDGVRWVLGDAW